MALLQVSGLAVSIQAMPALRDLSLSVDEGRMTIEAEPIGTRNRTRQLALQFDDPFPVGARLPRGVCHLIEDLPLHRLVATQPVGLAMSSSAFTPALRSIAIIPVLTRN